MNSILTSRSIPTSSSLEHSGRLSGACAGGGTCVKSCYVDSPGLARAASQIAFAPEISPQPAADSQLPAAVSSTPAVTSHNNDSGMASVDGIFGDVEFDLDFLTELPTTSTTTACGGATDSVLREIGCDTDLSVLCPVGGGDAPVSPATDSGARLVHQTRQSDDVTPAVESRVCESSAAGTQAPVSGPNVASISVVANRRLNRTAVTLNTRRGQQSFVLKTADLSRASCLLRAVQKRRPGATTVTATTGSATTTPASVAVTQDALVSPTEHPHDSGDISSSSEPIGDSPRCHQPSDDLPGGAANGGAASGGAKLLYCPHSGCGRSFRGRYRLKVHVLCHSAADRPFLCPHSDCHAGFYERCKLNRHLLQHADARHVCCTCGARFRQHSNLRRHVTRVHERATAAATPHGEIDCARSLRKQRLSRVRRPADVDTRQRDGGGDLFRCDQPQCDFTTDQRAALVSHKRQHAEKLFNCPHPNCGWSFVTHAKLKRHQRQHTGRRSFRCPAAGCDKAYRRLEYLVAHVRRHDSLLAPTGSECGAVTRITQICPTLQSVETAARSEGADLPVGSASGPSNAAVAVNCPSVYEGSDVGARGSCDGDAAEKFNPVNLNWDAGVGDSCEMVARPISLPEQNRGVSKAVSSRQLSGQLRALGVGQYPSYLHRRVTGAEVDGAAGCARTSLVYSPPCTPTSSGSPHQHTEDTHDMMPRANGRRPTPGFVWPLVTPSGLVSSNLRQRRRRQRVLSGDTRGRQRRVVVTPTSSRSCPASVSAPVTSPPPSHSAQTTAECRQQTDSLGKNANAGLSQSNPVSSADSTVFMDSLRLLADDVFRTLDQDDLVHSTINLDDLA